MRDSQGRLPGGGDPELGLKGQVGGGKRRKVLQIRGLVGGQESITIQAWG